MNDSLYSWIFFLVYIAAMIGIGVWSRRRAKTMESFSVGTRTVPPFFIGLSLAANLTSAATFVINPGLLYLYGWSGFLGYAVATPAGLFLALVVFSKSFRRIGDRFTVLTVPQWIGDRFGDARLKVWFGLLTLLQITFLVLIVVGLTVVLENALGIPMLAALALVVFFTFGYILLGGASAHIKTNSVQAFIMMAVAVIFIGSGLEFFEGGIGGFFTRLAAVGPHYASATNPDSLLYRDIFEVFVCNFIIGVAIIMQPHVISKALYLRTERDVNVYLVTGILVTTLFFLVLGAGLYARLTLVGPLLKPDAVIATYMMHEFTPIVRAVVVLGILSAGFSTMEGILVALSTIFPNDVLRNVLSARAAARVDWNRSSLKFARIFLVVLAPVTFLISWDQILHPSLSVAMLAQNGVYGLFAATFVPILFGVFAKHPPKAWAFASSVTALVVHFGMYYGGITMYHNNPGVTAACAIVAGVTVMTIGMLVRGTRADALSERQEAL